MRDKRRRPTLGVYERPTLHKGSRVNTNLHQSKRYPGIVQHKRLFWLDTLPRSGYGNYPARCLGPQLRGERRKAIGGGGFCSDWEWRGCKDARGRPLRRPHSSICRCR